MNLATTVLIALAVHFGGAEIDLARDVSLEWFQASRLERAWELQTRDDGVYTFAGVDAEVDDSRVIVERLSEPDRTYTVTHMRGDVVETISVAALVGLPRGSAVGRGGPPGAPIYVEQDGVLAALARSVDSGDEAATSTDSGDTGPGSDTAEAAPGRQAESGTSGESEPGTEAGSLSVPADPAVGRYEITRARGIITLIDAETAQVLTVRF